MPVLEAAHLQDDLRRAGIEPWGWIISASLAAARMTQPLLRQRAASEAPQTTKVRDALASHFAVAPMQAEERFGRDPLLALSLSPSIIETEGRQRVIV